MRSIIGILLAAVLCGCASGPRPAPLAERPPIFREISIGIGQRIALGAPVPANARPLLERVSDREMRVRTGRFGDADSIHLRLDAGGRVRGMRFVYAPGTGYDTIVASYLDDLGPPVHRSGRGASRVTRWEDARTRFEVFTRGPLVGSELTDRSPAPPLPSASVRRTGTTG